MEGNGGVEGEVQNFGLSFFSYLFIISFLRIYKGPSDLLPYYFFSK